MTPTEIWRHARGGGKKAAARLTRCMRPRTTVPLAHVEPELRLTVGVRRHIMFWSGGSLGSSRTPCASSARRSSQAT